GGTVEDKAAGGVTVERLVFDFEKILVSGKVFHGRLLYGLSSMRTSTALSSCAAGLSLEDREKRREGTSSFPLMPDFVPTPDFRPLPLLGNAHVQTVLGSVWHGRVPRFATRERYVRFPDGDRLVLHESFPEGLPPGRRTVLL